MQASNWIVGLLLLSVMAIKLLWGADLIITSHLTAKPPWWHILRDGALWLGWYFVVSGLFVYGVLGFLLLRTPNESVPLWFAIPALIFSIDCILAWHFIADGAEPDRRDAK